jgi:Tol biopolymer transport system component
VRVAFESDWNAYDFVQDIFVVGSDGSSPVLLTTGDIFDRIDYTRPSWSPDGARIAITIQNQARGDPYHGQIAVIPPHDGESATSLALSDPWSGSTWSPDGALILFNSVTTDGRNVSWVRADGSEAGVAFLDGWDAAWGR